MDIQTIDKDFFLNATTPDMVESLQSELLKMPQPNAPVVHTFMPGIYMRQLTIQANAVLVGHRHIYPHISMLIKGRITVLNNDGTTSELVAPLTMISPPGKKCAFAHEETIWVNVHFADCTDVETMEHNLYDMSDAPERIKQILESDKLLAETDYAAFLKEWNFTEEQVQSEVQCLETQMNMPYGIYKAKISDSALNGKGVFATSNICAGEMIGPMNINGKRTPFGRFTNHSHNPNAEMRLIGDAAYLYAISDITGCMGGNDGEEITTNYRHTLKLIGRGPTCQDG